MEAVTREEMFLAAAAGEDVDTPEPVTRREMFLQQVADNAASRYFATDGGSEKLKEEYLPGPALLYADEEYYLYATKDTSDTSKRMTRAELLEVMNSGVSMYVDLGGVYLLVVAVLATADFGQVYVIMGGMDGSCEAIPAFTAEYAAG